MTVAVEFSGYCLNDLRFQRDRQQTGSKAIAGKDCAKNSGQSGNESQNRVVPKPPSPGTTTTEVLARD